MPTLLFPFLVSLMISYGLHPRLEQGSIKHQQTNPNIPAFDGKSAFNYLRAQTNFGPRAPGSAEHEQCLRYLQSELNKCADAVNLQEFSHAADKGKQFRLTNIIASFNLRATNRILLTAHWDTRLWADQDPNPSNRNKPILGANDGASGVAVLLEIARLLRQSPPPLGIDIIFFDGEDLGKTGNPESFSVGSKYFARNKPPGFNPRFGINIDMVGDKVLEIPREVNSNRYAPDVMNLIYSTARELNIFQFLDSTGEEIVDDHLPLNSVGIRTVDLIDFHYPDRSNKYWHTLADTPDKCSGESLAAVGQVLVNIIYAKALTIQ
ncbi:MAG: M28 family peptidase [Ignavibacteriales bacterium]|nr:M28 family peptidase [Ignavibacteriales bacterium]